MTASISSTLPLMPIVIVVWVGFLVCQGLLLSARMIKSSFQKRMQQALAPTEEEVDELMQEQKDEEFNKSLVHRLLVPILKKLGAATKAKASGAAGEQVKDMLEQAGHPIGMHYAEFMGLKLFALLLLTGVGILTSFFAVSFILFWVNTPQLAAHRGARSAPSAKRNSRIQRSCP